MALLGRGPTAILVNLVRLVIATDLDEALGRLEQPKGGVAEEPRAIFGLAAISHQTALIVWSLRGAADVPHL